MPDWDAYFGGGSAKVNWDSYFGGDTQAAAPSYAQRTLANVPSSAAKVGERMLNPQEDIKDIYALGQRIKKRLDESAQGRPISVSQEAKRLASSMYKSITDLPTTFEKDPVGTAANVATMVVAPEMAPEARLAEGVEETTGAGLKAQAAAKLESAKQSGQSFPPSGITPVIKDIRSKLDDMGYDPPTHRNVASGLANMDRLLAKKTVTPEMESQLEQLGPKARAQARLQVMDKGPGHTFKDIHNAIINLRPAIKAGGTQSMMGEMMREKLDDYVFNLPKGPEFQQGMAEYSQARKLDTINEMKDRVESTTRGNVTRAGYAHALAKEFRKIADNPKKLRLWTPDEQAAIKAIKNKGNAGQWIAGKIGQFAPTGVGRIGIDVVIGHILGSVIPGGTYGLMAAGAIGRTIEKSLAQKRLAQFESLVSSGGDKSVFDKLMSRPRTAQAIKQWVNAKSGAPTKAATMLLTGAIAKEVNRPDLQPRIQQELENVEDQ